MTRPVLVTGSSGFTGTWLRVHIEQARPDWSFVGVDLAPPARQKQHIHADLRDPSAIAEVVTSVAPAIIIHLAARVRAGNPQELYESNVLGTLNLLEAATRFPAGDRPRVLIVGTAAEYGPPQSLDGVITETDPLCPTTQYGASKAAAEILALSYARRGELTVVAARTFNLIGPGQPPGFLCSDLVKQMRGIMTQEAEPILQVGNLFPVRDFIDVRDAVRAYCRLATAGVSGRAYNVGTGIGTSVQRVVDLLTGFHSGSVTIQTDRALQRDSEAAHVIADVRHIADDAHWTAEIGLLDTLRDMLSPVNFA